MISRELAKIKAVRAEAKNWVEQAQWRKARRELKKIRTSYCISESERVIAYIEAEILSRQGQGEAAAEHIKRNLFRVWGCYESFAVLNRIHPEVTPDCKIHVFLIKGGNRIIGYNDRFLGHYEVIAEDDESALGYILDLGIYPNDRPLDIIGHAVVDGIYDIITHCGVVCGNPFTTLDEEGEHVVGCTCCEIH